MPTHETGGHRRPSSERVHQSSDTPHTPIVFTRHNRPLHVLWLESQIWFSAQDLGRLIGRHLESHALRKLDPDQTNPAPMGFSFVWNRLWG